MSTSGPRAVGVDLGSRRVGVAVSDLSGVIATPHAVLDRGRSHAEDHRRLAEVVAEVGAGVVVVGLPLSLDGRRGPAAQLVEAEVAELRALLDVPVEVYDERFTTVTAEGSMKERGMNGRQRRQRVDQVAAAVLLQAWLDRRSFDEEPAEGPANEPASRAPASSRGRAASRRPKGLTAERDDRNG